MEWAGFNNKKNTGESFSVEIGLDLEQKVHTPLQQTQLYLSLLRYC